MVLLCFYLPTTRCFRPCSRSHHSISRSRITKMATSPTAMRIRYREGAAEWNSAVETEKAHQGLAPVPEGTSQLQPRISNPWLRVPTSFGHSNEMVKGKGMMNGRHALFAAMRVQFAVCLLLSMLLSMVSPSYPLSSAPETGAEAPASDTPAPVEVLATPAPPSHLIYLPVVMKESWPSPDDRVIVSWTQVEEDGSRGVLLHWRTLPSMATRSASLPESTPGCGPSPFSRGQVCTPTPRWSSSPGA